MRDRIQLSIFVLLGILVLITIAWARANLDSNSAFAQVVATSLLVLASMISASAAWSNVNVARKAREESLRPLLVFRVENDALIMENVGGGPAKNLEVNLSLEPGPSELERVTRKNLNPGELTVISSDFSQLNFNMEEIAETYDNLVVDSYCHNIFGTEMSIHRKHELESFKGRTIQEMILKSNGKEEKLSDIKSAVTGISGELADIKVSLDALSRDSTRGRARIPREPTTGSVDVEDLDLEQ